MPDGLVTDHLKIVFLNGQVANLVRDHESLLKILERSAYFRRSKKLRAERTSKNV